MDNEINEEIARVVRGAVSSGIKDTMHDRASQIYLVTRNSSGALAYPSANSPFSLKMYRKP